MGIKDIIEVAEIARDDPQLARTVGEERGIYNIESAINVFRWIPDIAIHYLKNKHVFVSIIASPTGIDNYIASKLRDKLIW